MTELRAIRLLDSMTPFPTPSGDSKTVWVAAPDVVEAMLNGEGLELQLAIARLLDRDDWDQ